MELVCDYRSQIDGGNLQSCRIFCLSGASVPYLQLGGGSTVISANSFWIRLAEVLRAFDPLVALALSLFFDDPPVPAEAEVDAIFYDFVRKVW